ncbi:hypothetical protein AC578_4979 [Pseudocercospora eumusae]|uniref:Amino-acid acetyltransferase, mitochondrial n=1 Tax=Pseudocercospora eumusae TaxID=321146 RepID=A0A139H949_9PEZI|nr:hypothetical protein AC578_4979 [Pseudocercospora eumusae]
MSRGRFLGAFGEKLANLRTPSPSRGRSPSSARDVSHTDSAEQPQERMGLHSLWPEDAASQAKTTIDIVAVHGLGGDAFDTWRAQDTGRIWLKDFLPEQFQDAHIMTFGYNSRVLSKSISGINDYARDLLEQLRAIRTNLDTDRNPLIFALIIAHERQELYESVGPMVKGIMFFGTPHRGSEIASWSTIFSNLASLTTAGQIRSDLLKNLESSSSTLRDISTQFVSRATGLQIVTFYEQEKLKGLIIVQQDSAELAYGNERPIPIGANHITMCKFSMSTSPEYKKVLANMKKLVQYSREAQRLGSTSAGAEQEHDDHPTLPSLSTWSHNVAIGQSRQHNGNVYNYYGATSGRPDASEPKSAPGNKHWDVSMSRCKPFLHFVGQETLLRSLEEALLPARSVQTVTGRRFVLRGLSGSGKTQVALRFAEQHRQSFWGVFWVDILNRKFAQIGFSKLARRFGSLVGTGEEAVVEITTMLANATKPWLLILHDPADPNYNYSSYIPDSPHGSVLVLMRSDVTLHLDTIEEQQMLSGLEHRSAEKLLARIATDSSKHPETNRSCVLIVRYLQAFPLALVVAGSLIASGLCSANEYPRTLNFKQSEVINTKMSKDLPFYTTYFAVFETTIHYLKACATSTAKHALQLHRILAFFDRASVCEDIFFRAWKAVEEYVVDGPDQYHDPTRGLAHVHFLGPWHHHCARSLTSEWASSTDARAFHAACALLNDLSLVSWDEEARTMSMHGALRYWARERLSFGDQAQAWAAAASILAFSIGEDDYWQQPYFEEPNHFGECIGRRPLGVETCFPPRNTAGIVRIYFRFYWQLLRSEDIRPLYDPLWDEMVRLARPLLGIEQPLGDGNHIALYHLRVVALVRMGRHAEAIQMGQEVLKMRQANFQPDHIALLWSKHSLASSYLASGQSATALKLLQEVARTHGFAQYLNDSQPTQFLPQNGPSIDEPRDLVSCLQKDATGAVETSISPASAAIWIPYDLGRAYIATGQHGKGLRLLEQCLLGPNALFPAGHYHRLRRTLALAAFCIAVGYNEKALQVLSDSVRMNQTSPVPEMALAHMLFLNHRFGDAVSSLKSVLGKEDAGVYALPEDAVMTLTCELYHSYVRSERQGEADLLQGIAGTPVNGKHAARNEDPATQRELLMDVLSASATKRDAKQYLARFNRPRKDSKGEKPDLYALLEDRNARNRQDQSRLDKTGVNLGGLYAPSRAIADVPQFSSEEVSREQAKAAAVAAQEELHVALVCLKAPEAIDEDTLDGLARTIAQLVKLDMRIILVLDININNVQAEKYAGSLVDVKALRKAFAQQADRLCDAIDRHNSEGARSVPNALEVVEDVWENGTETHELHVTMPNTLIDPLKRGMIPIIPSLAYTASGQLVQIAAADIMTTITKYLLGVDSAGQQIAGPPEPISLDRIIVLDAIGGIPSKDRGDGAHVFINLEQEFDNIEQELSEYADAAERNHSHPRGSAFYDQHRDNLDLVRKCLQLLPPSSSALITTPEEAASSSRVTKAPTLGAGTRRQKNPLIHNLLTNKPLISSSLPAARLHHAEGQHPNTPLTEASTMLRRGMPLIIIPAADRHLGWQRPITGKTTLQLDQDPRINLPQLVHLIEDSFRRKLNLQNYLDRIQHRLAGIIIAGHYEGAAILTWESPPSTTDPTRLVPYLDKFAVRQSSQGSSGVADIVFQAMLRSCFPRGVCWRSRKDNPVNKWYFERAVGSWRIPESEWVMFWTGEHVVEREREFLDCVAVCRGIRGSWEEEEGKKEGD